MMPGADDTADRLGAIVDRVEYRQHGANALRIAGEPHPDFRHHRERAFAANDRSDQIEPRRVFGDAADPHDVPFGRDDLQAHHMIRRDAVFERVRPTGIRADVAADRAGALARRIRGIVIARTGELAIQGAVYHARLDDRVPISQVHRVNRHSSA